MSNIDDIVRNMKESHWYKTVIGADTFIRIRAGGIPYEGETIEEWLRRTIHSLLNEISDEVLNYGERQALAYGGKLPFVVFGGKAEDPEKLAIYSMALKDASDIIRDSSKQMK